jgi:hypothetical protein
MLAPIQLSLPDQCGFRGGDPSSRTSGRVVSAVESDRLTVYAPARHSPSRPTHITATHVSCDQGGCI